VPRRRPVERGCGLTHRNQVYTLLVVYRAVAWLIISALIAAPGGLSTLHTHAYTDHDHPEHHHGPAVHDYHHLESRAEARSESGDGLPHLESCDPGEHVVSIVLACAVTPQVLIAAAECGSAILIAPLIASQRTSDVRDVRVHGPPFRNQAPPRAPPLILHT
jgi:hypothetical protein